MQVRLLIDEQGDAQRVAQPDRRHAIQNGHRVLLQPEREFDVPALGEAPGQVAEQCAHLDPFGLGESGVRVPEIIERRIGGVARLVDDHRGPTGRDVDHAVRQFRLPANRLVEQPDPLPDPLQAEEPRVEAHVERRPRLGLPRLRLLAGGFGVDLRLHERPGLGDPASQQVLAPRRLQGLEFGQAGGLGSRGRG